MKRIHKIRIQINVKKVVKAYIKSNNKIRMSRFRNWNKEKVRINNNKKERNKKMKKKSKNNNKSKSNNKSKINNKSKNKTNNSKIEQKAINKQR